MKPTLSRASFLVLLSALASRAEEIQPLLARPVTLPRGAIDITLHGTYTNWGISDYFAPARSGETLALGVDFGATDAVQLGLAIALPVAPGFAFGSIRGSAAVALDPRSALRFDVGYENVGLSGGTSAKRSRYFLGLGAPVVAPTATVAFVTGGPGRRSSGTSTTWATAASSTATREPIPEPPSPWGPPPTFLC